jgi:hypothetical protein
MVNIALKYTVVRGLILYIIRASYIQREVHHQQTVLIPACKYKYMIRPLFIAVFREYQCLKTYTALLYSLSIVKGKLHNVNMLVKYQCTVLYQNTIITGSY